MAADPPPPRLSRSESKEITRQALLVAAEQCFKALGYQGATLDAIAHQAGFTKGAVYWHFRNKEALFLELLDTGFRRNSSDAARLVAQLAEAPADLDRAIGRWLDQFDASSSTSLLALEMDLEARRNPSFAALIDAVVAKQQTAITAVLDRYFSATGRVPPFPVKEMAATILALTKAVSLARQTGHSGHLTTANIMRLLLRIPLPGEAAA